MHTFENTLNKPDERVLLDVFYLTVFDSFLEHERMHMLVIYVEYQGLFMSGNPKQMKNHEAYSNLSSSARLQDRNVSGRFSKNHILT